MRGMKEGRRGLLRNIHTFTFRKVPSETKQLRTVGQGGQSLYSLSTEFIERCTVYTLNCSVYSVQCTSYNV